MHNIMASDNVKLSYEYRVHVEIFVRGATSPYQYSMRSLQKTVKRDLDSWLQIKTKEECQ